MTPEQNLQLMRTLDDSWNAKELTTFHKRHAKDCVVRWPNQPPTLGIEAHEQEALAFFKIFSDQHLANNPYKVMIAERDWTCTIAEFTGTMKGPMTMADGKVIAPTNKSFKVDWHVDAMALDREATALLSIAGIFERVGYENYSEAIVIGAPRASAASARAASARAKIRERTMLVNTSHSQPQIY